MNNGILSRIARTLGAGFMAILEAVLGILGILGTAAVGYGWSLNGSLDKGLEFFIQEFTRFFTENQGNSLLRGTGNLFSRYTEVLSRYPWAHIAVLACGIWLLFRHSNCKRFIRYMKELFTVTDEEESLTSLKVTKAIGPTVRFAPGRSMARANADRKIGFKQAEESAEVVDTTGMPSVLARHANRGRKIKS